MDSFATTVSVALQYGVPLRDLVNKFAHVRFEPSGFTGNQEIPIAKSLVDYIFRWLGSRFLPADEKAQLGLIDRSAIVDEPPAAFGASALAPKAEEGPSAIDEAVVGTEAAASSPTTPTIERAADDAGDLPTAETKGEAPHASAVTASPELPPPAPTAPSATGTTPAADPAPDTREEIAIVSHSGSANGHANGNGKSNGFTANLGTIGMSTGPKVGFQQQADAPSCADCGSIMVRNGSCYKCLNCGSTSGCS
jgi:ribonucleoside-diphosphate reductase alpha chain